MMSDFLERFAAQTETNSTLPPESLQLLFPGPLEWIPEIVTSVVREYHPAMREAKIELVSIAEMPAAAKVLSSDGPPATWIGLITWGQHQIKLAGFDAPMPYGPVETCVMPAMMDPELKAEAKQHVAHALLYYTGTEQDLLERYVALAAVAGSMAMLGAIVVMNEEARAAQPAYDLVPDPEEDAWMTLRSLPIPYLYVGFLRMDVGDPQRVWVRTFANHRLGLPNLAYHTTNPTEVKRMFGLFAGMLGYLRETGENFAAGESVELGDGERLWLREPADSEWFLESDGVLLVVESRRA